MHRQINVGSHSASYSYSSNCTARAAQLPREYLDLDMPASRKDHLGDEFLFHVHFA